MRLMTTALMGLIACTASAVLAEEPGDRYLHNGSLMRVYWGKGDSMRIVYEEPRPGLGVSAGTTLFSGSMTANGNVYGEALVFASDCRPARYRVEGKFENNDLLLQGPAPVMRIDHCWTEGLEWNSNSYLRFDYVSD
jgi:hypothetical protein